MKKYLIICAILIAIIFLLPIPMNQNFDTLFYTYEPSVYTFLSVNESTNGLIIAAIIMLLVGLLGIKIQNDFFVWLGSIGCLIYFFYTFISSSISIDEEYYLMNDIELPNFSNSLTFLSFSFIASLLYFFTSYRYIIIYNIKQNKLFKFYFVFILILFIFSIPINNFFKSNIICLSVMMLLFLIGLLGIHKKNNWLMRLGSIACWLYLFQIDRFYLLMFDIETNVDRLPDLYVALRCFVSLMLIYLFGRARLLLTKNKKINLAVK